MGSHWAVLLLLFAVALFNLYPLPSVLGIWPLMAVCAGVLLALVVLVVAWAKRE